MLALGLMSASTGAYALYETERELLTATNLRLAEMLGGQSITSALESQSAVNFSIPELEFFCSYCSEICPALEAQAKSLSARTDAEAVALLTQITELHTQITTAHDLADGRIAQLREASRAKLTEYATEIEQRHAQLEALYAAYEVAPTIANLESYTNQLNEALARGDEVLALVQSDANLQEVLEEACASGEIPLGLTSLEQLGEKIESELVSYKEILAEKRTELVSLKRKREEIERLLAPISVLAEAFAEMRGKEGRLGSREECNAYTVRLKAMKKEVADAFATITEQYEVLSKEADENRTRIRHAHPQLKEVPDEVVRKMQELLRESECGGSLRTTNPNELLQCLQPLAQKMYQEMDGAGEVIAWNLKENFQSVGDVGSDGGGHGDEGTDSAGAELRESESAPEKASVAPVIMVSESVGDAATETAPSPTKETVSSPGTETAVTPTPAVNTPGTTHTVTSESGATNSETTKSVSGSKKQTDSTPEKNEQKQARAKKMLSHITTYARQNKLKTALGVAAGSLAVFLVIDALVHFDDTSKMWTARAYKYLRNK